MELSLKYYQDVVHKGILEMLPGSTTAVLETVVHLHMVLMNRLGGETRYDARGELVWAGLV